MSKPVSFVRWRVAAQRCNGVSLRAELLARARSAVRCCRGALPCRGLRLLLGDAAAADYAAWRPCCGAAAELPALCAAETCSWFAAARGVAPGVCATRAILLCGNRKPCGHCSALALCKTGMVAQVDSITYTSGVRMLCKLSFL